MSELTASPLFGIALSILAFALGLWLRKKTGLVLCNPLLVAILLVIGVLLVFRIPYENYEKGGSIINMLLAPATACLAVSIYARAELLKKNWLPILAGCLAGSVTSMASVYFLCRLFRLDGEMTWSLMPKSVTTPIAVSISEAHGGMVPITVVAVILTGIMGSLLAPTLIRLFRVKDSMEAGLAIGACSHAMGTSKAIELGGTEGAMSGLAIGICGIITVIISLFFTGTAGNTVFAGAMPRQITDIEVSGFHNGGELEPRELEPAQIEELSAWIEEISLEHRAYGEGEAPNEKWVGGTAYHFDVNKGELSFAWIFIDRAYIRYEGEWYEILDTQDPPPGPDM